MKKIFLFFLILQISFSVNADISCDPKLLEKIEDLTLLYAEKIQSIPRNRMSPEEAILSFFGRRGSYHLKNFDKIVVSKSQKRKLVKRGERQENLIAPFSSGGEAAIYVNPQTPNKALKVWNENRLEDFLPSTDGMIVLDALLTSNPRLNNNIKVAQVYSRGDRYIVKEFFPNSVPLSEVIKKDQNAKDALSEVLSELNKKTKPQFIGQLYDVDPIMAQLKKGLSRDKISDNIHWCPGTGNGPGKICIIDMLGF